MGITLRGSALVLMLAVAGSAKAEPDGGSPGDKADAGAPLVVVPNSSAAPASTPAEPPGRPAPPARDSTRTPMPDRLANDHWMQYSPMAAPTPPVPNSSGKTGGGANRVNTIFGGTRTRDGKGATGGAPPDVPRDSVTRTPEDQMAPPTPSSAP